MDNYDNSVIFMIRFQFSIAINFLNLMLTWQHNTPVYHRVKAAPWDDINFRF